jgi:hypothetical protein
MTDAQIELERKRHIATLTLARLAAQKAVKRRVQAEGKIRPWWAAPINAMAREYLEEHRAELFAQAALALRERPH